MGRIHTCHDTGGQQKAQAGDEEEEKMKLLAIIAFSIIAAGCSSVYYADPPNFQTIEDAGEWAQSAQYIADMEQFNQPDYWQSPGRFWNTKKGDCEDKAIFVIWCAKKFGYDWQLAIIESQGDRHAVIYAGGKYLEPNLYVEWKNPIVYETLDWAAINRRIR